MALIGLLTIYIECYREEFLNGQNGQNGQRIGIYTFLFSF